MDQENIFIRNLKDIDWISATTILCLITVGLVMIYSATLQFATPHQYILKQTIAVFIGLVLLLLFMNFNYRIFNEYYQYIFLTSILILISVLLFGKTYRGARSWFDFVYFRFQPSEITKIIFIVSLAGYLNRNSKEIYRLKKLFVPIIMLGSNIALILLQPDFSATLVYFPVFLVMLYCAGARITHISGIVLYGAVTVSIPLLKTLLTPTLKASSVIMKILNYNWQLLIFIVAVGIILSLLWLFLKNIYINIPIVYFICTYFIFISGICSSYFVDKSIKEYQKKRLVVFVNPKVDPLGAGYSIIQSKIAVGSGRIFGKGLFQGTQGQLGFLPAQHTDFILSLLSEEGGFVASLFVIVLYVLTIWRFVNVVIQARDKYAAFVATGISAMFAFYGIVNIGMIVGLTPITGLPLPFISYGGSSMIASMISVGILFSIYIRRFMY
ncbi:MAG: rod shape-determining protein RodA [Elusimicrobiota bacterium]|nr:rod shape-determining protein RodA [Elusimicrobiota bacterium]